MVSKQLDSVLVERLRVLGVTLSGLSMGATRESLRRHSCQSTILVSVIGFDQKHKC